MQAQCAFGYGALINNTIGYSNIGIGSYSLANNITGSNNTTLGYFADVASSNFTNATAIGSQAIVNASNKVWLGDATITAVEIVATATYTGSDGRFKKNIIENEVKGLEFINLLRPVVYNFDTRKFEEFVTRGMPDSIRKMHLEKDFTASTNIRHSGFIAQEVEEVAKKVGYDFDAIHHPENEYDNYSLAYSQFVVPLVKAVQELSSENKELKTQLDELSKRMATLELKQSEGPKNSSQSEILNDVAGLEQNAPNPFRNNTIIRYNIPSNTNNAQIVITDIKGTVLKTISLNNKGQGQVTITAGTLMSGSYIYSLIIDGRKTDSKQMILTK